MGKEAADVEAGRTVEGGKGKGKRKKSLKRRRGGSSGFETYIYRVLRQVHPELAMSRL